MIKVIHFFLTVTNWGIIISLIHLLINDQKYLYRLFIIDNKTHFQLDKLDRNAHLHYRNFLYESNREVV